MIPGAPSCLCCGPRSGWTLHCVNLSRSGYLPGPWLGDEASSEVAAHYTRRAMEASDSSYQALQQYRAELESRPRHPAAHGGPVPQHRARHRRPIPPHLIGTAAALPVAPVGDRRSRALPAVDRRSRASTAAGPTCTTPRRRSPPIGTERNSVGSTADLCPAHHEQRPTARALPGPAAPVTPARPRTPRGVDRGPSTRPARTGPGASPSTQREARPHTALTPGRRCTRNPCPTTNAARSGSGREPHARAGPSPSGTSVGSTADWCPAHPGPSPPRAPFRAPQHSQPVPDQERRADSIRARIARPSRDPHRAPSRAPQHP